MRALPQLSLFPLEPTSDSGLWIERFSRYFDDPKRHSGFLELAESAVSACPGDPSILTLAATAALLDQRPERGLVFLKRISKRYGATPTDHLLQALALFQEGKRLAARELLLRHELTEWPAALQVFPAGMERMRWLAEQIDAIMQLAYTLPQKRQPAAAKSKAKLAPASRPERERVRGPVKRSTQADLARSWLRQ